MAAPQIVQAFASKINHAECALGISVLQHLSSLAHVESSRVTGRHTSTLLKVTCAAMCTEFGRILQYDAFMGEMALLDTCLMEWQKILSRADIVSFLELKTAHDDHLAKMHERVRAFRSSQAAFAKTEAEKFREQYSESKFLNMTLTDIVQNYAVMYPEFFGSATSDVLMPYTYLQVAEISRGKRALYTLQQSIPIGFALQCLEHLKMHSSVLYECMVHEKLHDLNVSENSIAQMVHTAQALTPQILPMICAAIMKNIESGMRSQLSVHKVSYLNAQTERDCHTEQRWIDELNSLMQKKQANLQN